MFCAECGAQINDKAVVCTKCGVSVAGNKLVPGGNVQVSNHIVGAVLTTLFCCQIGGVIAIVYASRVNTKLAQGDVAGALAASKTAHTWIIVNLCCGLLSGLLYVIIYSIPLVLGEAMTQ